MAGGLYLTPTPWIDRDRRTLMIHTRMVTLQSSDSWTSVSHNTKNKLFRVHNFLFLCGGHSFSVEIQESQTGDFLGHAENMADPHDVIPSSHGSSVDECLQAIIETIEKKAKT